LLGLGEDLIGEGLELLDVFFEVEGLGLLGEVDLDLVLHAEDLAEVHVEDVLQLRLVRRQAPVAAGLHLPVLLQEPLLLQRELLLELLRRLVLDLQELQQRRVRPELLRLSHRIQKPDEIYFPFVDGFGGEELLGALWQRRHQQLRKLELQKPPQYVEILLEPFDLPLEGEREEGEVQVVDLEDEVLSGLEGHH